MQQQDPNKLFGRVVLNNKGIEKNERIKMAFEALYQEVMKYATGDPRCTALMTTSLEEAAMWAQKSMSRDEENQNLKEMHNG